MTALTTYPCSILGESKWRCLFGDPVSTFILPCKMWQLPLFSRGTSHLLVPSSTLASPLKHLKPLLLYPNLKPKHLIFFCSTIQSQYKMGNVSFWLENGTFEFSILWDLHNNTTGGRANGQIWIWLIFKQSLHYVIFPWLVFKYFLQSTLFPLVAPHVISCKSSSFPLIYTHFTRYDLHSDNKSNWSYSPPLPSLRTSYCFSCFSSIAPSTADTSPLFPEPPVAEVAFPPSPELPTTLATPFPPVGPPVYLVPVPTISPEHLLYSNPPV